MRVLEVRGRKTGRWYQRPVAVAAVEGRRFIVSLWGDSEWARNLRAGAGAKLRVGSRIEPIEAHELEDGGDKAAVIARDQPPVPVLCAGLLQGRPKQVTLERARELATRHPVFRIETAGADWHHGAEGANDAPTPMRGGGSPMTGSLWSRRLAFRAAC